MPLSAPIIAALIGAGTAGTEMGLQATGALTPSTSSSTTSAADAAKAAEAQQKASEAQAFKHFAPDAQVASGGFIDPASLAALDATYAGSPGDITLAQQTIFGNTNPTYGTTPPGGLASSVAG